MLSNINTILTKPLFGGKPEVIKEDQITKKETSKGKWKIIGIIQDGQQRFALINDIKKEIELKDPKVKGFNIGCNVGKVSGQSIFHCHIHIIPRREGDVENPQGGVRSVIPLKQHYTRKA